MSNINRCGTCRFWPERKEQFAEWDFNLRTCGAVKQREDLDYVLDADGHKAMDEDGNYRPVSAPKAMAVDGSGYFAALKTAEDFGCVLWEPKS